MSTTALAGVSVLHVMWASGSPWPAKSKKQLGEAVIGSDGPMPGVTPTLVVAGGTAAAALLASGALGEGPARRLALRGMGAVMAMRAVIGGGLALAAMGLPAPGRTFRDLDNRLYRPFAALLGVSLWLAAHAETPEHG
ncbi:DUF3995 domain-containing protein [Microbacterium trichothecenolyticum]|uniref:DUF3995 domain-containing protein n=1 Tax=Microbacterium trichothecenolyticum TaxID=69370 RepID=UPI0027D79019|nr:DUF3995 domain-containing protein [Microbacterium trichothecenolyticum]